MRLNADVPGWALPALLGLAGVGVAMLLFVPGSQKAELGAESALASAVERTMAVPGARITYRAAFGDSSGDVKIEGSGILNMETARAATGNVYSATADGGGLHTSFSIVDGLDGYTRSEEISADFGTSKPWIFLDGDRYRDEAESLGLDAGSGDAVDAFVSDPTDLLAALGELDGGVTEEGADAVDGIPATLFSAVIDYSDYVQQVEDGESDPAVDTLMGTFTGTDEDRHIDIWVGVENGLIIRERISLGPAGREAGVFTQDYSDFGIRPKIDPPPQSRVYDATPLLLEQLHDQVD